MISNRTYAYVTEVFHYCTPLVLVDVSPISHEDPIMICLEGVASIIRARSERFEDNDLREDNKAKDD